MWTRAPGNVAAAPLDRTEIGPLLAAFLTAEHGGDPLARLDDVVALRVGYGMSAEGMRRGAGLVRDLPATTSSR